MRYFKLKALSCSAKGRVLRKKNNEVYRETAFNNVNDLVDKGYLYEVDKHGNLIGGEPVKETSKPAEKTEGSVIDLVTDALGAGENDINPYADAEVDDFKLVEWKAKADDAGLEYKAKATRQELLDMLKDHHDIK